MSNQAADVAAFVQARLHAQWLAGLLRSVAAEWSDHPDYRQEWG